MRTVAAGRVRKLELASVLQFPPIFFSFTMSHQQAPVQKRAEGKCYLVSHLSVSEQWSTSHAIYSHVTATQIHKKK